MLTKEQQIEKIHKQLDEQKENVAKLDDELLVHIEDAQIAHLSFVYYDARNDKHEVMLSGVIGDKHFECVIYKGKNKKTADQIVNSLLETFDLGYAWFDEEGNFNM